MSDSSAWRTIVSRALRKFRLPIQGRSRASTRDRGDLAEDAALRHLQSVGYKLISRGLSDSDGELDLVLCAPDETTVVVEVRSARGGRVKRTDQLLPRSKQRQVVRTARRLLLRQRWYQARMGIRFDAVFVCLGKDGTPEPGGVHHVANAFHPDRSDWF